MPGTLKELHEETVASQLKVWDDEIEHLDAKADILLAQMEERYWSIINSLRAGEEKVKQQLETLRAASDADPTWQQVSAELAHSTHDMKSAIDRAAHEIEHAAVLAP